MDVEQVCFYYVSPFYFFISLLSFTFLSKFACLIFIAFEDIFGPKEE